MDVVIEKRRVAETAHARYRNTLYRNAIESRVKIQQNSGISLDALKLPSRYFATAARLTATQRRSRVASDPFACDERGQISDLIDRPLLPTHAEPTRAGEIFEIRGCVGPCGWCERWTGSRRAIKRGLRTLAGRKPNWQIPNHKRPDVALGTFVTSLGFG